MSDCFVRHVRVEYALVVLTVLLAISDARSLSVVLVAANISLVPVHASLPSRDHIETA